MSTLSKVMVIVGLLLVLALYVTHRRNVDMQRTLGEQQTTITHLQTVNSQQATELREQQLMTTGLRLLLSDQNAALADLDNQNRKTADELQQALATPPGLVPHCPEPDFTGATYGEAVRFIPTLQTALRRCQTQINTLNHWIEQEETTP